MATIQRVAKAPARIPLKPGQVGITIGRRSLTNAQNAYTCTSLVSKQEASFNLSGDGYKLWEMIACGREGWDIILTEEKIVGWGIDSRNIGDATLELLEFGYLKRQADTNYLTFIERPGFTDV